MKSNNKQSENLGELLFTFTDDFGTPAPFP
jgi:hypothetical protein